MEIRELTIEKREDTGKGPARRLRRDRAACPPSCTAGARR